VRDYYFFMFSSNLVVLEGGLGHGEADNGQQIEFVDYARKCQTEGGQAES
jgi:hypothetical protein